MTRTIRVLVLTTLVVVGAACNPSVDVKPTTPVAVAQQKPAAAPKRVQLDKNVFLEIDGPTKRVIVESKVCLRMGSLEQLLTRKRTKEHEAILVADCDASKIHAGLLLCGVEPGSPVQFQPNFVPPKGPVIKVFVEYKEGDKTIRRRAQEWIRESTSGKDLATDWVFTGRRLFRDPMEPKKPPYYMANDGDIVVVSNFDTSMIDLPIESSDKNVQLQFDARTDRIPALDTPVTVILEPVIPANKDAEDAPKKNEKSP
jgi:hypothetical protein